MGTENSVISILFSVRVDGK